MQVKSTLKKIGYFFLTLFVLVNILAAFHAWKFTHFDPEVTKATRNEWELSLVDKVMALTMGVSLPRPENVVTPEQAFKTIHIASNRKIECWYMKQQSSKGTVLICHGYGGSKGSMLDKAAIFHYWGYNVLLPDFMGSGGSEGNECTIGYKEARQVTDCVNYLQKDGEQNVILYGTSMGAAAIMKAMQDDKLAVSGLILECPFGTMLRTVQNRFAILGVPATPLAHFLVFWGGTINGFNAFSHNPQSYASSIKAPTLLMYGEDDPKVSMEETQTIFNNLQGPKRLLTFKNTGHSNYLSSNRETWTAAVDSFLSTSANVGKPSPVLTQHRSQY